MLIFFVKQEYIIDGFGEVSNRQMVSIADRSQPRAQRINAVSAAAAAAQGESINVNRAPITSNTMSLDAYFHQRVSRACILSIALDVFDN